MTINKPNKTMPPSLEGEGGFGLSVPGCALLVFGHSPGAKMQSGSPHPQYAPLTTERPAIATELNAPGRFELLVNAGMETTSNMQRQTDSLASFILSPLQKNVGYTHPARFYHVNSLLTLFSRIKDVGEIARHLMRAAELASGRRDHQALAEISSLLCSLPNKAAQSCGLYYKALAIKQSGRIEDSKRLLDSSFSAAPPAIEARALQALGSIYEAHGKIDEAIRLYTQTMRLMRFDAFASIGASIQISAIKSMAGDHEGALSDLENLWPLVRVVALQYPHLYFQFHNEIAFELGQVGRLDDARRAIAVAVASPVATAYPEWSETAAELALEPKRICISIPQDAPGELEIRPRTLIFSEPSTPRRLPVAPPSPILTHLLACVSPRAPPLPTV
jgi:tetratricopeptide (TPR) repeat protein